MQELDADTPLPPLRADLRLERADGREVFVDGLLGRRLPIDARGAEAARAMDRPQTLGQFAQRVGADLEAAGRIVALFSRMRLLQTDDIALFEADRARLDAVAALDAATVPLLIREDARFGCTMCGSCCGGHNVGPVLDDTLAALADKLGALKPKMRVDKGYFFPIATGPGQPDAAMCQSEDGWCVFLTDARRCLIHQEHGGDAKPRACQLFPYQFIATPAGVAVSLASECRGFVEAKDGPRLVDQEAELRRLLAKLPALARARAAVAVDGTALVDWATYEDIEARLHAAVDAHASDDVAAVLAMRAVLAGPGEAAAAEPAELAAALAALVEAMRQTVAELREAHGAPTETAVAHVDALDGLDAALGGLCGRLDRVATRLDREPLRELFVAMAHHHLMSKQLLAAPALTRALGRFACGWFLAKSLALARARAAKRRHLVAQDVQDAIVVIGPLFCAEAFGAWFRQHDAAIQRLFWTELPALIAAAPAIRTVERRVEIHKF
jgi:Fe-S-cluster containining protein